MKKPTHTAAMAMGYKEVIAQVSTAYNMSNEERNQLIFEVGCAFIDSCYNKGEALGKRLLKDKSFGYWDWLIVQFVEDDKVLLPLLNEMNKAQYRYQKYLMLDSMRFSNAFINYIKSLERRYDSEI